MMTRGRTGRYRQANAYVIDSIVSGITEMIEGLFDRTGRRSVLWKP